MSKGAYQGVISQDRVVKIIVEDDPKLLVEEAERAGEVLAQDKLTKSQIRNLFGAVRQIQMNWTASASQDERAARVRQLLLLKPKLAYQAAREPKVRPLADALDVAIDQVDGDRERFLRFVELFEAILAYHTRYGGK